MVNAPGSTPRWRVALVGARGTIGSALRSALESEGHSVLSIGRSGGVDVRWDPAAGPLDPGSLRGVDAVVNVAGERIDQRWTEEAKRRIVESRVTLTAGIARAIATLDARPRALISMSAIGIYGDRGDDELDETSALGTGFLAGVVRAWEDAAAPAREAGVRVVHPRTGPLLYPEGGMLGRLLPVFRLGAGGRIGDGTQWISWISRSDTVRAFLWLLGHPTLEGPVNLVAPEPVRNEEFARGLARAVRRPAIATVPAFAVKVMYGQMAEETILSGQRVRPRRLLDSGFTFAYPTLDRALAHELSAR